MTAVYEHFCHVALHKHEASQFCRRTAPGKAVLAELWAVIAAHPQDGESAAGSQVSGTQS